VAYGKRWARPVSGAALAIAAALAVQGCTSAPASPANASTAEGAPAVTAGQARQAFDSYVATTARAGRTGDGSLALSVVTGPQQVVAAAAPKEHGYDQYAYGAPTFYLPEQAGYPRFFVADVAQTLKGTSPADAAGTWLVGGARVPVDGRALMLFEQSGGTAPWLLASVSELPAGATIPRLATDGSGHVPTVPLTAATLLARPDIAGPLQAAVVDDGPASPAAKVVAGGPLTTGMYQGARSSLQGMRAPSGDVYQWELEGSKYAKFALRTADGGALVFYAMYLNTIVEVPAVLNKSTPVRPGPPITVPPYLLPLLPPGKTAPRVSLASQQLLSFAAVDPPAGNRKIQVIAIGGGLSYASASLPAALASEPGATSVLITRVATDSVVNVNRSLSQISPNVRAARSTAEAFRDSQAATRSLASPCPPTASTSLVSAACAPYRSSRRDDRAIDDQRSSRGSATIRSLSLPICSRSATAK
jgi:hypothetical protein